MVRHILISTLFAAVAALLTLALRRNRAATRYWVWMAASIKFAVPFSLLTMLGTHVSWRTAPVIEAPAMAVTMTFAQTVAPLVSAPIRTQAHWDPAPLIILVWAAGALAVLVHWLVRWRRMSEIARAASPLDLDFPVPVRSCDSAIEPGVFGIFRPVLLLPAGITVRLTPKQLRAILLHEASHVRRRDNLTAFLHMLIEAAFWFHPLVWWIGARLVDERERACDEAVLECGSEPAIYAEGILNICKLYVESPLACVSGVTGANLKQRIEAIMTNRIAIELSRAKIAGLIVAAMAAVAAPVIVGIIDAPPILAQGSAPPAKFEVASVKLCKAGDSGGGGRGGGASPGRLDLSCRSLKNLIRSAYQAPDPKPSLMPLAPEPVEGGPSWVGSDRYRIQATAEGPATQATMRGPMMCALLEERFKLKIHEETKEVPAYLLIVAKGGAKLRPFEAGSCVDITKLSAPPDPNGKPWCGVGRGKRTGPNITYDAYGQTLDDFARNLGVNAGPSLLDRPVFDGTGIAGLYDFHLEFVRDENSPGFRRAGADTGATPAEPTADPPGPSIFAALEQHLGLKLVPSKGASKFLVIDRIERPSEN